MKRHLRITEVRDPPTESLQTDPKMTTSLKQGAVCPLPRFSTRKCESHSNEWAPQNILVTHNSPECTFIHLNYFHKVLSMDRLFFGHSSQCQVSRRFRLGGKTTVVLAERNSDPAHGLRIQVSDWRFFFFKKHVTRRTNCFKSSEVGFWSNADHTNCVTHGHALVLYLKQCL